jgi:hypothetical protein
MCISRGTVFEWTKVAFTNPKVTKCSSCEIFHDIQVQTRKCHGLRSVVQKLGQFQSRVCCFIPKLCGSGRDCADPVSYGTSDGSLIHRLLFEGILWIWDALNGNPERSSCCDEKKRNQKSVLTNGAVGIIRVV